MDHDLKTPPPMSNFQLGVARETLFVRSSRILILLVAITGLAIVAAVARISLNSGLAWHCPVMFFLGFPCPSCGSTRALRALTEFRLCEAWRFNPLFVSMIALGPTCYIFRTQIERFARYGWPIFFGAVAANWLYLLFFLPR